MLYESLLESDSDYITLYINTYMDSHWKTTLVYKLTKREPSHSWKQQYKRIIIRKLNRKLEVK